MKRGNEEIDATPPAEWSVDEAVDFIAGVSKPTVAVVAMSLSNCLPLGYSRFRAERCSLAP